MLKIHPCGGMWAFCDGECETCPYESETTDRTENATEAPKCAVAVQIRDDDVSLMLGEPEIVAWAKEAARTIDGAIAGEICQVLARYGICTEPGEILKRLEELDDRSNKRYRDGYLDGYRKALEDQERTEVPR